MGKAKTAIKSKNDPNARGSSAAGKTYDGKEIIPVLYVGAQVGHGKYIAAAFKDGGNLVMDKVKKKPIFWAAIH